MVDFSELYRADAGDVYRFALFLSGDAAVADDIVSEPSSACGTLAHASI